MSTSSKAEKRTFEGSHRGPVNSRKASRHLSQHMVGADVLGEKKCDEDALMKCARERDMMVPVMGTVLTSESSQTERRGMPHGVDVSVVIPCLNEANSLACC